jgi:signal transduction histidine kinase
MIGGNVLVVDDNVELAENVCEILSDIDERPIDCLMARSGAQAMEMAREHGAGIDVMIVDRRLPDTDGLELVSQLKASCPIAEAVIITGDAKVESALAAVGRGVFAYVLKPFHPGDLVHTVTSALAKVRLARERESLRTGLEDSERRHRTVVEAVPAFVLALGPEGDIRLWNRRLEDATGFSRDEMLGKNGTDLVGNGGDRRLPLKQGGHRMARWQLAQFPGRGNELVTYALGIDVTEERSMLRRTLLAERLAAVGTLAAGLAHEVRNPLNSATLQLQVLRRRLERGQTGPEALLPVVEVVHDEIRRLDRLVTDFLAFARPHPLALKPTALHELVASVAHQIEHEARAAGIKVELREDPGTGMLEADPERLRQVLINLMRNALEAMGNEGTLKVSTRHADAEGYVAVLIEDTGPGIPEDAPIFDAFYTTKGSGTGLGLAIVHRIVQEHGGTIQFESRPGGTSFTVRLPQMVQS